MNLQSIFTTVAATLLAAASLNTLRPRLANDPAHPDFAPGSSGSSALIDPFSVDLASPGVFIGCWSDSPEGIGSVLHLDPNGNPSVVDTDLDRVYGLGCIPSSQTPTLYAVGDGKLVTVPPFPRNNPNVWKVRKSITGGGANSWATDDTFYLSTKAAASARGITTDAGGNVYVCGLANPNSGNSHWIVRKLPPGGSWTTVLDVSGQGDAIANGMCFFPGNWNNSTKQCWRLAFSTPSGRFCAARIKAQAGNPSMPGRPAAKLRRRLRMRPVTVRAIFLSLAIGDLDWSDGMGYSDERRWREHLDSSARCF